MLTDIAPEKISARKWSERYKQLADEEIRQYTYYGNPSWGVYLQPPATFMVYGARQLKRLQFDNSLAALRMWGFVFNESERLFRARQDGKKLIATMGDLGTVPVIVMAFPGCIPFYPECIWWTPFFNESTVLLDKASELGTPEAACFSRVALAAFFKKAYFPVPDRIFASTGATCDDYSSVMQSIENLGYNVQWIEAPYRRSRVENNDHIYEKRFECYLVSEYQKIWKSMVQLAGEDDPERLKMSIQKTNVLRKLVSDILHSTFNAPIAPFPALELMTIEFGNLYGYADIDEWISILEMILETITARIKQGVGIQPETALPIAWINPTADPYLLNFVEDLGLRVVSTEYVIRQALVTIDETIDPFHALARSFMHASLIGSTRQRITLIQKAIEMGKIKGVLITNMLGGSHCAMETKLMETLIDSVPVLSLDVPPPPGITEQIKTRLEAFAETLHGR
jgi:benzoyl-CoA reductase/2-hydroxyglutaryl-CoA dehydratase subunit BcrC/BadD/HgdB